MVRMIDVCLNGPEDGDIVTKDVRVGDTERFIILEENSNAISRIHNVLCDTYNTQVCLITNDHRRLPETLGEFERCLVRR